MDNEMDCEEVYREMVRMAEKKLWNILCTQQKCEEASDKAKRQKSADPEGASVPDEK